MVFVSTKGEVEVVCVTCNGGYSSEHKRHALEVDAGNKSSGHILCSLALQGQELLISQILHFHVKLS